MANDPRIPNVVELDDLDAIEQSEMLDAKVAVKDPSGNPNNMTIREIIQQAFYMTIGPSFPTAGVSVGDFHLFNGFITSGLDWDRLNSSTQLTYAAFGDIALWNGTRWKKVGNVRGQSPFTYGSNFPTYADNGYIHIFDIDVASGLVWKDLDSLTDKTNASEGDVGRYDGTPTVGSWVKIGNIRGKDVSWNDVRDKPTLPISADNFPADNPTNDTLLFFNADQSTFTAGKTVRNEADTANVTSAIKGTIFKFQTTGNKWIRQYVPSADFGIPVFQELDLPDVSINGIGVATTEIDVTEYKEFLDLDNTNAFIVMKWQSERNPAASYTYSATLKDSTTNLEIATIHSAALTTTGTPDTVNVDPHISSLIGNRLVIEFNVYALNPSNAQTMFRNISLGIHVYTGAIFTPALKSKLDSIESNAKDDQTGSEIVALLEALPQGSRLSYNFLDDRTTIPGDTTVFKGTYADGVAYAIGDIVIHNNDVYLYTEAVPSTNTTDPDADTRAEQLDIGGPNDHVGAPTISGNSIVFPLRSGSTITVELPTRPMSADNFPATDPANDTLLFFNADQSTFTAGKTVRNEADDADVTSAVAGTLFKYSATGTKWIRQFVPAAGLTESQVDARIHPRARSGDTQPWPQSKHARRVFTDLTNLDILGFSRTAENRRAYSNENFAGANRTGDVQIESYLDFHGKFYRWEVPAAGGLCILADLSMVNNADDRATVGGSECHIANDGDGTITFEIGGIGQVFPDDASIPPNSVALLAIEAVGGSAVPGGNPAFRLITSPHDESENIADLTDEVDYLERNAPAHWHVPLEALNVTSNRVDNRNVNLHGLSNILNRDNTQAKIMLTGTVTPSVADAAVVNFSLRDGATEIINQDVTIPASTTPVDISIEATLTSVSSDTLTVRTTTTGVSGGTTLAIADVINAFSEIPIDAGRTRDALESLAVGERFDADFLDNLTIPFDFLTDGLVPLLGNYRRSHVATPPADYYYADDNKVEIHHMNGADDNEADLFGANGVKAGDVIRIGDRGFVVESSTNDTNHTNFNGYWVGKETDNTGSGLNANIRIFRRHDTRMTRWLKDTAVRALLEGLAGDNQLDGNFIKNILPFTGTKSLGSWSRQANNQFSAGQYFQNTDGDTLELSITNAAGTNVQTELQSIAVGQGIEINGRIFTVLGGPSLLTSPDRVQFTGRWEYNDPDATAVNTSREFRHIRHELRLERFLGILSATNSTFNAYIRATNELNVAELSLNTEAGNDQSVSVNNGLIIVLNDSDNSIVEITESPYNHTTPSVARTAYSISIHNPD